MKFQNAVWTFRMDLMSFLVLIDAEYLIRPARSRITVSNSGCGLCVHQIAFTPLF